MNQLLSIDGDKIIIDKLRVKWTEGPLTHAGSLEVVGVSKFNDNVNLAKNIDVTGTITADTINVKHIICDEPGSVNDPFSFVANTEKELDGKGFRFTDGNATRQFVYKEGEKMFSSLHIDLARNRSYKIENIPVLSMTSLGDTVVNSSLQTVGELHKLKVSGEVAISEWAFFNPVHNRLGLNTESPNSTLGIVENNVEIILGSQKPSVGYIGTFTNSDLEIGTDNTTRVTIKNTGEIVFGHAKHKNAVIRIHGRLEVDEIVNDPREGKFLPLTFKSTKDTSIYGTGIVWQQGSEINQFVFTSNPDRIVSSSIIDLATDKWFAINGAMVLSRESLGASVTRSSLTTVGMLEDLVVNGETQLNSTVRLGKDLIVSEKIAVNGSNQTAITDAGISVAKSFSVVCDGDTELKIDNSGSIELGNKHNTNRKINMFGQVSVNISNPDPDVAFTVGGAVSLNNKKFVTGSSKPTAGTFRKGDICWNTEPEATAYIGWICVREGTPGEWLPFGQISDR
jgi:hypothetical protein